MEEHDHDQYSEKKALLGSDDDLSPQDKIATRRRRLAILTSVLTMFLGSVMFSITLPSMVYFYDIVEGKVLKERRVEQFEPYEIEELGFYGIIVASFSIGQAIASPPLGRWYNKRSAKGPYIFGLIFLVGGSLLYFFTFNKYMMLVARFIVGVGSGTATVCRAHVSNATPMEKRTGAMALIAAAQAIGFIIGPAFALAFSNVNVQLNETIFFDEYTAPGLASAILGFLNLLLVLFLFKETPEEMMAKAIESAPESRNYGASVNVDDEADAPLLQKPIYDYDKFAIFLNMIIFFCVTTGFSVFETIGTPFTSVNLGWSVEQNSLFFTIAGVASIVSFILVRPLTARVGDRVALCVGLLLMCAGLVGRMNFSCEDISNCPVTEVQYWTTTFCLYTIGYPVANAVCFGIFAKIMGPAAQGTMTGWQMFVGSLARMVGPMWAAKLFEVDNGLARYVFGITAVCCFIALLIVIIWWKRFVPFSDDRIINGKNMSSPVANTLDHHHHHHSDSDHDE